MDYFGINSPEDLPKIKEVLADQIIEPTIVHHTDFEQSEALIVTDSGELVDAEAKTESEPVTEEGYVNGHSFDIGETLDENTESEEQPTEDEPTEEAIEEYITDEVFIEGDEEESEEIVEEEVAEEDASHESEEEDTNEETNNDEASSNEDDNEKNASEEKEE
jgi:segregation and condensation protein B